MKRKGWEVKCVPVEVARASTKRNMDDRMWLDKAEMRNKWVRMRRPSGRHHEPFQAFSLCDVGGDRGTSYRRAIAPHAAVSQERYIWKKRVRR